MKALSFILLSLGISVSYFSHAQTTSTNKQEKVTVRVKVTDGKGENTKTTTRTYTYHDLTPEEQEAKVKSIIDSVRSDKNGSDKTISVIVEDDKPAYSPRKRVRVFTQNLDTLNSNNDFFYFDNKAFADRMKQVEKDIRPQLRRMEMHIDNWSRDFEPRFREFWSNEDAPSKVQRKIASIRGLEAFPNNPDKSQLNIRFYAPEKGDVTITITDTKGKQVVKKEVKDFEGDYVGQIEMPKDAKGTYFLTVVQREDGAVKRLVIE